MAKRTPHMRRLSGKTDYKKRLALLKSGIPRLIVRKSIKNIVAQVVEYRPEGDIILAGFNSSSLKKLGWEYKRNNLPAAYLAGLITGMKAKEKKVKKVILDIGLQRSVKGSRIYAVVKGVIDAGIEVPHNPDILPSDDRLQGKHIMDYAKSCKKEDVYKKFQSKLTELKNNIIKGK